MDRAAEMARSSQEPGQRRDMARPEKRSTLRLPHINIPHLPKGFWKLARRGALSTTLAVGAATAGPVASDVMNDFLHPINADNIHQYLQQSPRAVDAANKLRGADLGNGEKRVTEVKVISQGDGAKGVYVREVPTDRLLPQGNSLNPQLLEVPPVGIMEPGTTINNVIEFQGNYYESGKADTTMTYDGFFGQNVHGTVISENTGQSVTLAPDVVYFVSTDYTQPIPTGTPASNGGTPTP